MKLGQFTAEMSKVLEYFQEYWEEQHDLNPEDFSQKDMKFADWKEQFDSWHESTEE